MEREPATSFCAVPCTNWPGIYSPCGGERADSVDEHRLATCTNTHRARAVANNSNDAFTTSLAPFMIHDFGRCADAADFGVRCNF